MKTHKSESVNQYGNGDSTVCITRAAWRREHDVTKKDATLFIGGAWGDISRKFAADIIKQFRRDARSKGGAK
jgi:hypothetical protein